MLSLLSLLVCIVSGTPEPSACDGIAEHTVEIPVHGDYGDAFQYKKNGVTYTGSSGEIFIGKTAYHGNAISALRFDRVQVPKLAVIASATVRLVDAHAGSVCCQGSNMTVLLHMEHAAHSTPLPHHHTDGWLLSTLPTTPAVAWKPPVTGTYNTTETPDLREIIQSLVSHLGWAPGNAMTLLLDGEGVEGDVDERVYFGSGVSSKHRAKLKITFCERQGDVDAAVVSGCPPRPKCAACPEDASGSDRMSTTSAARASRLPWATVTSLVGLLILLAVVAAFVAKTKRRRLDFGGGDTPRSTGMISPRSTGSVTPKGSGGFGPIYAT